MSYNFPTAHSPYTTHQPVGYPTSSHSHHGHGDYTYGAPLRRTNSAGHLYAPSPTYGYTNVTPSPGVQYLTVPGTHRSSRSQSRHRHDDSHGHHGHSHGHSHGHGHGHGYSTSASHPVTYTTAAPVYHQPSTRHRSHSRSHAQPSHARSHSHSHYPDARGYHDDYRRGRTASFGDRVRDFFGMDPSSSSYYNSYGNVGRSRHNSFSGHKHQPTRTGPLIFGSTLNAKYVDKHGREVDHRGRPIHRY